MPAYLKRIVRNCRAPRCTRNATDQLMNSKNAPLGTYCSRHAEQALKLWREKGQLL